jgi:hypothetical protein
MRGLRNRSSRLSNADTACFCLRVAYPARARSAIPLATRRESVSSSLYRVRRSNTLIEPLDPITLQAEARPSIRADRKSPARCSIHRLSDARVNNHNARSNANVPFAGSGEAAYGVIKKASEDDGKGRSAAGQNANMSDRCTLKLPLT